jgi:cell wall-associated NlpC family hydrolase
VKPAGFTAILVAVSLLAAVVVRTIASADPVSSRRAQAAAIAGQLNALSIRASQAAEAYDEAQLHLKQVNAQLTAARQQLGQTGSQLSAAQARVKHLAIQSYMQGGAASQLSLLIPSSADQLALRGTYVSAATGLNTDAIDALRSAHIALGQRQAALAAAQAQAKAAVAAAAVAQQQAAAADAQISAAYTRAQAALGQAILDAAVQARASAEQAHVHAALSAGNSLVPAPRPARVPRGVAPAAIAIPTAALPPPSSAAGAAIRFAEAELGKPYMYGGGGPNDFDCSGLTAWAWGHAGHPLPHSSEAQYYDTTHVSVANLEPGDLVFYGMPPHHVGIYVGGGEMINALHSGTNVEYDSIYIESDLIGGGRVN